MSTEVIATDEFADWYQGLLDGDSAAADAVFRVVSQLEAKGVALDFPYSSRIVTSQYAMRELRTRSLGRPLRIFYIFDVERQAVLLLGGDKTGDDRFYDREVRRAERIWEQYEKEQGR